jgi:hypothetical protein
MRKLHAESLELRPLACPWIARLERVEVLGHR